MSVSLKILVTRCISFVIYVNVAHLFPFHFYFLTSIHLTSYVHFVHEHRLVFCFHITMVKIKHWHLNVLVFKLLDSRREDKRL
jgi:hypothetical protein